MTENSKKFIVLALAMMVMIGTGACSQRDFDYLYAFLFKLVVFHVVEFLIFWFTMKITKTLHIKGLLKSIFLVVVPLLPLFLAFYINASDIFYDDVDGSYQIILNWYYLSFFVLAIIIAVMLIWKYLADSKMTTVTKAITCTIIAIVMVMSLPLIIDFIKYIEYIRIQNNIKLENEKVKKRAQQVQNLLGAVENSY